VKVIDRLKGRREAAQVRERALHDLGGRDAALASVVAAYGVQPDDPAVKQWTDRLEARRAALLASGEPVELDFADGPTTSTVAEVCSRTSKNAAYCRVLLQLARIEAPAACIEMGTSIGMSGSYLAAGLKLSGAGGRLVTLDRQEHVAAVVRRDFDALGLDNVEIVLGRFDQTLPDVLARNAPIGLLFIDGNHHEEPTLRYFESSLPHLTPDAVVVFDDIAWSDGMKNAWARLRAHDAVAVSATLGAIGIVRVKPQR